MPRLVPLLLFVCLAAAPMARAGERVNSRAGAHDWPQWQGPDRNSISHETGLLTTWPKGGPPLLWTTRKLGGGYSGPSVAAGHIYGMSYRKDDEVVWALDEETGKEIWATRIAQANYRINSPTEGSRCTPTVDGEHLYVEGVSGDVVCLEAAGGKEIWHKNLVKDFGGHIPGWGYSESPLVDGDKLVVTPGGSKATLVALDKKSGTIVWRAPIPQGNGATYSSIIVGDLDGQRQYIQLLNGGVVGVAAEDGHFLWRYAKPGHGISISTPIYADHDVFAASGYGVGGGLAHLTRNGIKADAREVYFTKRMKNHHGGMVLVDGRLYGANDPRFLVCLDFKTGKVLWDSEKPGKGSVTYADGHLYYRNEGGPIILVEANPTSYVECGRFEQPNRSGKAAWPHPVIANGKLYIRDQEVLLCYDVRQH